MQVLVHCPQCRQGYHLAAKRLGQTIRCHRCGANFVAQGQESRSSDEQGDLSTTDAPLPPEASPVAEATEGTAIMAELPSLRKDPPSRPARLRSSERDAPN